ncbi:retrovirus-related pol polyprotein from transposon TNT 1-94 [Tanacetum coccineum]
MGLPEFVDDTVTDYSRPTPSIDVPRDVSESVSFFEQRGSIGNVLSKPMISFVKETDCPSISKVNNTEKSRKPTLKKPTCAADLGNKEKLLNLSSLDLETKATLMIRIWDMVALYTDLDNISYLSEYEPYDGGYVSFGHGGGKITGKGTIKTGIEKWMSFVLRKVLKESLVAERRNGTLIEAARTMLADTKLPVTFWAEAVSTACYVQNRVLVDKSQNKTPYELFNGRSPNIGFLRPFGCRVMILNTLDHLGKFNGTKEDTNQAVRINLSSLRFIALPNWFHDAHMETSNDSVRNSEANDDPQKEQDGTADVSESSGHQPLPLLTSKDSLADHSPELPASPTVETVVPTVSTPIPTGSKFIPPITLSLPKIISRGGSSYLEPLSLGNVMGDFFGDTTNLTSLTEVEADISNMETGIQVSPTPTLGINIDHPKIQIIGPIDTLVQTRHKAKNVEEQSFIATIHQKTNPDLLQFDIQCAGSDTRPPMLDKTDFAERITRMDENKAKTTKLMEWKSVKDKANSKQRSEEKSKS